MPAPAPLREPRRERARQRVDRPLQLLHLLARRVHEVDVLGQRLAQRARHRLDAAVGDEPAADLRLDQLPQLLAAAPRTPRARAARRARPRRPRPARAPAHQLARRGRRGRAAAACGTGSRCRRPGRPGSMPANRCTASAASRRSCSRSMFMQRVEQHLGELLVATSAHRAGRRCPAAWRVARASASSPARRRRLAVAVDAAAEQREVDVEDGVERALVPVVLHQRRAEHRLEHLAVVERDVLDRAHRVEVLGHRHRQPGGAQLVDEPLEDVEQ